MSRVPRHTDSHIHYVIKVSATSSHTNKSNIDLEFTNPVILDKSSDYEIGLLKGILPRAWHNVSVALGNQSYKVDATDLNIPDGVHTIATIETHIKNAILILHDQATADEFSITADYYNGGVTIVPPAAASITIKGIGSVLGIAEDTVISGGAQSSTSPVNLTGGVHEIEVLCDLVESNFSLMNNRRVPMLYTASPPEGEPFGKFNLVDSDPYYLPITHSDSIHRLSIQLVNQNGALLNLSNLPDHLGTEYVISLRKKRKI